MEFDYDILFLGGGLNYAGAIIAARAGLRTALVEQNMAHLGGTCLHNGCIPSKMYLHAAETVRMAGHTHFDGSLTLNMKKLDEEKEALLSAATAAITKQCGHVDLIEGRGVVTEAHTVMVSERKIRAEYVVIGTGATPFVPEGIAYDGKSVITSDEVLNMKVLPKKIAVYGAGAIALEMASFFAASGVETELIWRHEALQPHAHPLISKNIKMQFEALGLSLRSSQSIAEAKPTKRGVHIVFENGKEHYVPMLLVATGRKANVSCIGTEAIAVGPKGIETDAKFETSLPGHYAVGDCNGKLQLAHAARAQVLNVVQRITDRNPDTVNMDHVVKFIHTLPCSYAQVGEIRSAMEARGKVYKESLVSLKGLPFPHTHDADLGIMAVYSDEEGFVVGGEIFSPHAEELIGIVAMAIAGEMDAALTQKTILAHPTFSESLEKSFLRL